MCLRTIFSLMSSAFFLKKKTTVTVLGAFPFAVLPLLMIVEFFAFPCFTLLSHTPPVATVE